LNDLNVVCIDCGEAFTFTVAEQRFYAERGLRQPVRCGSCRAERRAERNAASIANFDASRETSSWSELGLAAGYGLGAGASSNGQRHRGPRQSYHATCAACGKETEVPFLPRAGRPVYCRECFNARRGR
jgi:CxxC-x17-CxxC domain-containing protein